jgi:hypothetical protein
LDPFPGSARIGGCGFSIMGMGYFGFGSISSNYDANDLWKYNPDTKSWTSASNFIGPPRISSTYGSNGKIAYYGFGYKLNTFYNDLYL